MPLLAAMLLVCGGGPAVADGAEGEDGEATQPVAGRRLQESSKRKLNWGAANLQPSWNNTAPVAATAKLRSLTAEEIATRKATFERLRAAHAAEGPKAALHNVSAESITVLGKRNGFTYGVWKGGTGGTMPIRLYFGPNEETWPASKKASSKFKATLRRSAKIWSKRLVDDGQRNDVKLEGGRTLKDVRGILLQVLLNDRNRNAGGIRGYRRGTDGKLRPYSGLINISRHVHDNLHDGMTQTIAHEIGHVLGIVTTVTKLFSSTYYDHATHTWNGPNAKRVNGGKPVPMQWVNANRWWEVKKPHEVGAKRDLGHIGLCISMMAYCTDRYDGATPSELDFAILADIGFTLLDSKVAAETERYGYTAWGEWAAYGVAVERDLQDNFYENPHDYTQAYADAFGTAPGMPLADNASLSGNAVWKGNLLGVDLGRARLPPVVGKAKLSVDLATLTGHVRFSDLTVHVGSGSSQSIRSKAFRRPNLRYGIDVTGNNFADANNRVQGGFYGPAHQEMAGVVNDTRPEVNLLGGFGGAR